MSAAAGLTAIVPKIVEFLMRHPTDAFRPVPIAKAIGEQDIRRVRAALRKLKDAGDVVTCTVYPRDELPDEEFRIVSSAGKFNATVGGAVHHARGPAWKPLSVEAVAAPIRRPVSPEIKHQDTVAPKRTTKPAAAPKAEVAMVPQPTPAAPAPAAAGAAATAVQPHKWRGVQQGSVPTRQNAILAYINRVDRPAVSREMCIEFQKTEPGLSFHSVTSAIWDMVEKGKLVDCGSFRAPGLARRMRGYATPAIALRLAGGELPVDRTPSTPPTCEAPTAIKPIAPLEGVVIEKHPGAERSDRQNAARGALEEFLRANDGGWYSLSWMTRIAGGNIVATLDALADWHRAGRVVCSEADKVPVWRPVRGAW
jgi:hypothetical protein